MDIRLDTGHIFAIGEVDVRSIDADLEALDNDVVGLQILRELGIVHLDHAGHSGKVVANLDGLEFTERGRGCAAIIWRRLEAGD